MANSVITTLNATSWNGQYEYDGCVGSFDANSDKVIQNINGNKEGLGSFDANRFGDTFNYNPHFSDLSKAGELIALMTDAISAVEEELAEE